MMTIAIPSSATAWTASAGSNGAVDCSGARIRAHCRHLATVVTIRGEIDSVNVDAVNEHIQRFIINGQNPVVLDMSDVSRVSGAGIWLVHRFDEECCLAGVEWTLIASPAIIELLGDAAPMFPLARSVHEALHSLADAIVSRRQRVLPLIRKTA